MNDGKAATDRSRCVAEVEAMIAELHTYVLRRRVVAYSLLALWGVAYIGLAAYAFLNPLSAHWPPLVLPAFAGFFVIGSVCLRPSRRQRQLTTRIARVEHVEGLAAVLEAWHYSSRLRDDLLVAETALLKRLKASDRQWISARHFELLRYRLHVDMSIIRHSKVVFERTLAILGAMEQIGDETVLKDVERLAEYPARNQAQRAIQEAAQNCLIALRARLDQTGAMLLRVPSRSPEEAHLLRGATPTSSNGSEELLRLPINDPAANSE